MAILKPYYGSMIGLMATLKPYYETKKRPHGYT